MILRRTMLCSFAACVALAPRPAAAQSETKAASVAAFDDAERLMAAGKVADACIKFGESQRLDPQLGTLLHLADCLEKNGQTASAWAAFREAAELASQRQDPRLAAAEERIQALTPKLSKLQINVPSGADTAALHIERDEVVVGTALWGAPTPTDPGPHTITVSAPGRRTWKTTAVVRADGSTTVVDVPALEKEIPKSPEASAAPSSSAPAAPAGASQSEPNPPRWTAITAAGIGVVGLAVGTIFGLSSKSKHDEAEEHCNGNLCSAQGVELADEAMTAGNISTIGFVVGGIGLAAGATLWIVGTPASSPNESALSVGVGPGQLVLRRTF